MLNARGSIRRLAAALGVAALTAASWGQLGSQSGNLYGKFAPGDQFQGLDGQPLVLVKGQRIRIQGSDAEIILGEQGTVLPIGAAITVDGKEAVVPRPRTLHSVAVFPLTYFSVAGTLFNRATNEFTGGTQSVTGAVYSYDAVSNLDKGRRFELGGFYFMPYDDDDGDLFQVAARYFPNKEIGFQIAYIDTTRATRASSGSAHLLVDLSSQGTGVTKGRRITARLGLGLLQNFSKEFDIESGSLARRNTTNFSTFFDLGVELTDRIKLTASEWFIRDRNSDVNRFGIGLSYKL